MKSPSKPLVLRILHAVEDGALVFCLGVMILLAFGQIVLRNFFSTSLQWADGFLRYMVLWVAMLGAMVATREDNHINIDVISRLVQGRARKAVRVLTDLFTAFICALLTYASVLFLMDEMEGGAKAFADVPVWVAELILPVAFFIIALRYLILGAKHLIQAIRGVEEAP